MAIAQAEIPVELREILLKNKPQSMLEYSSKGTVPVLVIEGKVIDESLDVMHWSLRQNDHKDWLRKDDITKQNSIADLISQSDEKFKPCLDKYKYSDRYPEPEEFYFEESISFLEIWNKLLNENKFLIDNQPSLADVAIFPFVRQFAFVNKKRFDELPYTRLQEWLSYWLDSKLFLSIMEKYKPWEDSQYVVYEPFK